MKTAVNVGQDGELNHSDGADLFAPRNLLMLVVSLKMKVGRQ